MVRDLKRDTRKEDERTGDDVKKFIILRLVTNYLFEEVKITYPPICRKLLQESSYFKTVSFILLWSLF